MKFGENVKTTTVGALMCCGGLLCDKLRNSPERKAPLQEGVKLRGVRM